MDPSLYSAAMEGKVQILAATTTAKPLDEELAPNGNTVIHVAAQYGNIEWIRDLLVRLDSSLACKLLRAVNLKGETALHVAAREGYPLVIRVVIQHAKAMEDSASAGNSFNIVRDILTSTNKDDDTALHLALRSSIATHLQDHVDMDNKTALQKETCSALTRTISTVGKKIITRDTRKNSSSEGTSKESCLDTVKMLVFPNFVYLANKVGETPLYLAAECACFELVKKIAENSAVTSPDNYSGPGGRTALHAAVTSNHQENTKYLWYWMKDLANKPDERGWTPFHCAAEFGRTERVKQLLGIGGKSLAYQTSTEGEDTALHIAASKGHKSVVQELVMECPGCWEMVNSRDQNVLHIAIEKDQREVIKFFERDPLSLSSLVNQKDINGNTPIHIAASYCRMLDLSVLNHASLQRISFNKDNQTPLNLLESSHRGSNTQKKAMRKHFIRIGISKVSRNEMSNSKERKKYVDRGRNKLLKNTNASSVVAALVATVTFTAGITVPGGYNSNLGPNQGSAMLLEHTAFQIFVVADTLAFLLSTFALLSYFFMLGTAYKSIDQRASEFTYYSVLVMVLAFTAGTYAVLSQSPALAIPLCIVTSIYCLIMVCVFLFAHIRVRW